MQENAISEGVQVDQATGMLNLISKLKRFVRSQIEDEASWQEEWLRDPFSLPDLQNMTLEQLADLPFERRPSQREGRHGSGVSS